MAGSLLVMALSSAFAGASGAENQLNNPGFETVTVSNGVVRRGWTLNDAEQVPDHWALSSAFPGELLVVESGAAGGGRFVQLAAPAARAAHIYQACPLIQKVTPYEVALRYQGGPVKLQMYEYDDAGRLVGEHVFAQSYRESSADDSWRELIGYYTLPDKVVKVSLAIVVPAGSKVAVDDLRRSGFVRSSEKLNVRDFGAS